ncbi:hypothetical protein FEM48_Zijuj01G0157600 [Ziziphus jujuba var. spinosa]|uniref:Retrotransposon gag domain-containing protein n=1 Tax=Ziziphus jujuba var. spinosa TaxID=714518 RepID=A0A978W247_ZIZJJ|nr:hypothetical protein FEM48_Zijuj01G0157600 [Ziziphus jujuba var. spinosa]
MPLHRRDINNLRNVPAVNQENALAPQGNAQAPQANDFMVMFQKFMQAMTNVVQQQPRAGNANIVEQFRRLQSPSFEGSTNPLVTKDWIREMEKIFSFMECTDAQKVTYAIYMLKQSASHWWKMISRACNVERNPITWVRFKELIYEKYFPQTWRDNKIADFIELKQGKMTLAQYERKFDELSRYAPYLVDTDESKAQKFEIGLKDELRRPISVLRLRTYGEVL